MITETYSPTELQMDATEDEIRSEPMLFNADAGFAWKNGGPLTRKFLDLLDLVEPTGGCVIDTRSHMLMPGQYPCIPGWHLDSIPRKHGQPDITTNRPLCRHYLCVVGISAMTEFLDTAFDPGKYDPQNVYASCNEQLNRMEIISTRVKSGLVYRFGDRAWHQGTPATERCWRWFVRASFGDGRSPRNEIRTQTQVYANVNGGW